MRLKTCAGCGRVFFPGEPRQARCPNCTPPRRPRGNAYQPTRLAVAERDRWTCQECRIPLTETTLHIGHRIPRSAGGSDHPSNLYASCKDCNLARGAQPFSGGGAGPART